MRAAIYARYSSELQNDRSVDDQIALCRDFAGRNGYSVAATYDDRARTGTTTIGREGLQRLILDARAGKFDTVIVEALDRLSRDTEDLAGLHKRLTFAGVDIVTVHDGRADALQVGIRGLMSTLFIADLRHKTRRGLAAVVADGRHAGGRAYGYRAVPGQPGQLEIVPGEAAVVRRIFADYVAGRSPRDIAAALNAEGVVPPRGARWVASTINGNLARAHGIIQNAIYCGDIIWNKTKSVRDPETGRRIFRANPESEWKRAHNPDLIIVPADEWQAAQAEKLARGHTQPTPFRRRKRILSGLLRCGCCGGGMTLKDVRPSSRRIVCSTWRESGSCTNSRAYPLNQIERAVIDGVLDRLRHPDALVAYVEALQTDRRAEANRRATAERAVTRARTALDHLQRNLIHQRIDEDFFDREAPALRRALADAQAQLDAAPPAQIVTLHPAMIRRLESVLAMLSQHLPTLDPTEDRDLIEAFRALIDRVVVRDRADGGVECEVIGHISGLIGRDAGDTWGVSLVARGRLLPLPPMQWGTFAA